MGIDAVAALVFGRWYDKVGMLSLAGAVVLSSVFAVFAFASGPVLIIIGVCLWGVGMGAQESIVRAVIADIVPIQKRGTGYGIFNAGFGICWFSGSVLMGILYDFSIAALIGFSVLSQLASLPLLFSVRKRLTDTV